VKSILSLSRSISADPVLAQALSSVFIGLLETCRDGVVSQLFDGRSALSVHVCECLSEACAASLACAAAGPCSPSSLSSPSSSMPVLWLSVRVTLAMFVNALLRASAHSVHVVANAARTHLQAIAEHQCSPPTACLHSATVAVALLAGCREKQAGAVQTALGALACLFARAARRWDADACAASRSLPASSIELPLAWVSEVISEDWSRLTASRSTHRVPASERGVEKAGEESEPEPARDKLRACVGVHVAEAAQAALAHSGKAYEVTSCVRANAFVQTDS
jgi:hypothetical protein